MRCGLASAVVLALVVLHALAASHGIARAEEQDEVGPWSTRVAREGADSPERAPSPRRERQGRVANAPPPPRAGGGTPPVEVPREATPAMGASAVAPAAPALVRPPAEKAPEPDVTQRYCAAAAPTAEQARLETERQQLAAVAAEIETRIKALEGAIAEHKEWVGKRQSFHALAQDSLLRIFARMKVEAASAQLAQMDPVVAAAVLSRIEAKAAGAILAEIEPAKAARIAAVIAGAAEIEQPARPDVEAAR